MPRFSRGWRSGAFDRIPSEEELVAERLEGKFSRGKGKELVPGYEEGNLEVEVTPRSWPGFYPPFSGRWIMGAWARPTNKHSRFLPLAPLFLFVHDAFKAQAEKSKFEA